MYADYLISSGDLVKAFPILKDLSAKNPLRGLQAAAVARRLKQFDQANAIAKRSLDVMRKMSEQDPENLSVSLAVAQNRLFLERFGDSIDTLDKAIKLAKTPEEEKLARQAFGDAICTQVKHIQDNSDGSVADQIRVLKMLHLAATTSPESPRLMNRISRLLRDNRDGHNEEVVVLRAVIQTALDDSRTKSAK